MGTDSSCLRGWALRWPVIDHQPCWLGARFRPASTISASTLVILQVDLRLRRSKFHSCSCVSSTLPYPEPHHGPKGSNYMLRDTGYHTEVCSNDIKTTKPWIWSVENWPEYVSRTMYQTYSMWLQPKWDKRYRHGQKPVHNCGVTSLKNISPWNPPK